MSFFRALSTPFTLPVSENRLIMYAAHMAGKVTPRTLRLHISAIRSLHVDHGKYLKLENMWRLKRVLDGVDRTIGVKAPVRAAPLTTELLNRVATTIDFNNHNDRVFFAICTTATYGLLRLAEVVANTAAGPHPLLRQHLQVINGKELLLTVARSKTDQLAQGFQLPLAANGTLSCPVHALVLQYINRSPFITASPHTPLFLLEHNQAPTRDWVVKRLRLAIGKLGLQPQQFSGHSFRRGGTTSLAHAGVPDHLIQQMGRWKSATYQAYIEPHQDMLAKASRTMAKSGVVFGGVRQRNRGNDQIPPASTDWGKAKH